MSLNIKINYRISFRYELDPDDGYISKIISGIFRSTKNRTNQQKKAPQRQSLLKRTHTKQHAPKQLEPTASYHFSTNSYEFDAIPIGGLELTSKNPLSTSVSSHDARQHLTETTRIRVPALTHSKYNQPLLENRPFDVEDYIDSNYKTVPVTKPNSVITYTQNSIGENAVSPTGTPLISYTTETNSIHNSNNTLLTEILQKLQGTTQQQSQISSNLDNVEVDYSVISLFKILNDFKKSKNIIGSPPEHQYYVQTGAKDVLDDNIYNEKPVKGPITLRYARYSITLILQMFLQTFTHRFEKQLAWTEYRSSWSRLSCIFRNSEDKFRL